MSTTVETLAGSPSLAQSAAAPSRKWPGVVALVLAAAALTLCLAAVVNIRVPLSHGPGWWQFVRVAGFLAFWLACLGALLGVFVLLQAMRRGAPRWLGLLAVGLSLAALAVAGWGVWQVHTPAYWLQDPREPSTAQLDALGPESVVRTYFTSQDLSVQYRLSDAAGRASMTDPNVAQDLSLLAGVDHLRVTPMTGASGDAGHRSFAVTYTSRAPDAAGAEPGQQAMTVDLTRQHGGPWRVSYWGFPLYAMHDAPNKHINLMRRRAAHRLCAGRWADTRRRWAEVAALAALAARR